MGGKYSGGCYNGAISLGVFIVNSDRIKDSYHICILTQLLQFLGAWVGVALALSIKGEDGMKYTQPMEGYSEGFVFYVEMLCTFFITTMALHQKTNPNTDDPVLKIASFAISTFAFGTIAGPYTGGCLSPQVCTASMSFNKLMN